MRSFNTGNNPPRQKNLLKQMAKLAETYYDCRLEAPIGDAGGRYAFRMTNGDGQPFILVAKGSRLWVPPEILEPVISIQRQLLKTASLLNRLIVLAYRPSPKAGEFVSWYRFDPSIVLQEGFETNLRSPRSRRPPTKMWNFPLRLGEEIEGPHDAYKVLSKNLQIIE